MVGKWICVVGRDGCDHRRINTEEKAKVVWGTEIIQFLATLAILHFYDFED